ncbi:hypothetical protein Tco_0227238 [Tanacetum coccineum]
MAALQYKDDHNRIAYLGRERGSEDFIDILSYLDHSPLSLAMILLMRKMFLPIKAVAGSPAEAHPGPPPPPFFPCKGTNTGRGLPETNGSTYPARLLLTGNHGLFCVMDGLAYWKLSWEPPRNNGGSNIDPCVIRVKKLERNVQTIEAARLLLGPRIKLTVPSEDIEEREEEEVPLRRKRSVHRRARTEFYTPAVAQFHAPRSTDVPPPADISESAGPSVGADKGKAPMPEVEIPAEFLAEDAQARITPRRRRTRQVSRLSHQLQAEDFGSGAVPPVSEGQLAKEIDELLLRNTDTD